MKKMIFACIALMLAVGFTAFKNAPKKFTLQAYHFTASTYTDQFYDNAANWDKGTISCDELGEKLCQIDAAFVTGSDAHPDFSGLSAGDHVNTTTNTAVVNNKIRKS